MLVRVIEKADAASKPTRASDAIEAQHENEANHALRLEVRVSSCELGKYFEMQVGNVYKYSNRL